MKYGHSGTNINYLCISVRPPAVLKDDSDKLSGASFDEIGAMIDDAATEDHLKQIIILAGTHEMTEDVPTEKIQVDFKALLRKAQAVTSEITVSSVLGALLK